MATMSFRLSLALLSVCSTLSFAAPDWQWKPDGRRSIELTGDNGPIVRYLVDPAPSDPHFDLLATPDGRNLVWVAPDDHAWHYGHWFSWKLINGVNFWETNKKTGASAGRTEVLDPVISHDDESAHIRYRRLYRLPDRDAPIMEDRVVITIWKPEGTLGPKVDWQFTTTALSDVKLDRTPLPGEPGGVAHGGYGGLSWRGAKALGKVRFLDSTGRAGMDIHRKHSSWVDATGTLAGKPAGIAIFDHSKNPGHPTSWFLVKNQLKHGPFWYVNPALVQPKPIDLKKGESLTYRYRVLVHDGSLDAGAIARQWQGYVGQESQP